MNRGICVCGLNGSGKTTQPEKVIYLDGTRPILENVQAVKSLLLWEKGDRAAVDEESI